MKAKSRKLKCPFKVGDLVFRYRRKPQFREGIYIVLSTQHHSSNCGRFQTYYMWLLSQRTGKRVFEASQYVVAVGGTDE